MSITSYEIFKDSLLCSDKKFQSPYDVFNDFFLYSDKKSQLPYDVFNDFFLYSDKNTKTVVRNLFLSERKL